jgi:hypothetical protein
MNEQIKKVVEEFPFVKECVSVNLNSMFGPDVYEIELKVFGPASNVREEFNDWMKLNFPNKKFNYVFFTKIKA